MSWDDAIGKAEREVVGVAQQARHVAAQHGLVVRKLRYQRVVDIHRKQLWTPRDEICSRPRIKAQAHHRRR